MPPTVAPHTKDVSTVDVESGDRITPSGSSLSLEGDGSDAATPQARRSRQYEDTVASQDRSVVAQRWRKVQERMPAPVMRISGKIVDWVRGPEPPKIYHIKPLFEPVQTFPVRLVGRLPKAVRAGLFGLGCIVWIILFGVIITNFGLPSDIGGFGAPVRLSCVARLWSDSRSCGMDGQNCLPFDDAVFAFNCPADCASVKVLNPRTIGNEEIIYRPLVVGGAPDPSEQGEFVYRGDSFICGAAIHAGIISNGGGGCGVIELLGEKPTYGSVERNGITSVGFNTSFPMSYDFLSGVDTAGKCRDPRWNLLTLSTIYTALFSLLTSHPATFFAPIFTIIFFQIAMGSDPPSYTDYSSLASTAIGNFLPAAFIAYIMYRIAIRRTLLKMNAHIEKTILWLGACWVGALSNITLDMIPIQRLTPHDLKQQPGAITALVFIVLVIFGIALYQAWCFRAEGRLPRYLAIYAILGISLGALVAMPKLNLRIHHYILGLLLLPGTALQTRPSLIYQGLLVGLFINGIARWGFAPILETAAALRGDAQLGTGIPFVFPPVINGTNISFTWAGLEHGYEGVSVLVNDVERFRGYHTGGDDVFSWTRRVMDHPEFFRFAFVNYLPFGGVSYSDFTKAGTWWPNGTWSDIPPGRSS